MLSVKQSIVHGFMKQSIFDSQSQNKNLKLCVSSRQRSTDKLSTSTIWKLDKTVTIRELTVIAKTKLSSDFELKC